MFLVDSPTFNNDMAILDALPEDIIWYISSMLDVDDHRSLRLVCRNLSRMTARFALEGLHIRLDSHTYSSTREKLEAYAQGRTAGTQWARSLTIACSSRANIVRGAAKKPDEKEIIELKRDLPAALAELNLHTLRWDISKDDHNWSFEVITQHLADHPVRNLSLEFRWGFPDQTEILPSTFGRIGRLQQLTIAGNNVYHAQNRFTDILITELANIIDRSPALTHLSITSACWAIRNIPSLHQFLKGHPDPRLTTLYLDSLHIAMDDITTPYFRSLDSLTIRCTYIDSAVLRAEQVAIWKTLQAEHIKLHRVEADINGTSEELLKYLEYCKGTLTELVFRSEGAFHRDDPEKGNNIAVLFYSQILPQIASDLVCLRIHTSQANKWCFGEDNAPAIGKCKNLKMLAVSIIDSYQSRSAPVRKLLQDTVAHMPISPQIEIMNVHQVPQIG